MIFFSISNSKAARCETRGLFSALASQHTTVTQYALVGLLNVFRSVDVRYEDGRVSRLVAHRQYVGVSPQHVGYARVLERIELIPRAHVQRLAHAPVPIVAERLLAVVRLAGLETLAEEVIMAGIIENAQFQHQLKHVVGQRYHGIIMVLSVAAVQVQRLSLHRKVAHFKVAHFLGTHEKIVQDVARQQVMLVMLAQPLVQIRQHLVGDDVAALALAPALHQRIAGRRVYAYVASLKKVLAERLEPRQVIVACLQRVVAVDEDIVQELAYNKVVELVYVEEVDFLLSFPLAQDVQAAIVRRDGFLAHVVLAEELKQVLLILLAHGVELRVLERLHALYPRVPAAHQFLGQSFHEVFTILPLLPLAVDMSQHDLLHAQLALFRVECGERDVTLRGLVKLRQLPADNLMDCRLFFFRKQIFFWHL